MSQGRKANEHGEQNRKAVAGILLAHGFIDVGFVTDNPTADTVKCFETALRAQLTRPRCAFAENVVLCNSIHEEAFKAHFLLWMEGWPRILALMCREQHSSGSVVWKLEYLYATINERFPCRALVMLEGAAFKPPVVARARQWIGRSQGRLAHVFVGLPELRCWLTEGCSYPPDPLQLPLSSTAWAVG